MTGEIIPTSLDFSRASVNLSGREHALEAGHLRAAKNAMFGRDLLSSSLQARPGVVSQAYDVAHLGIASYTHSDIETGAETTDILVVGSEVYLRTRQTLTITYSGSANTVLSYLYPKEGDNFWTFEIFEDGNSIVEINCGGFADGSLSSISDLAASIDSIAGGDYSTLVSGGGSTGSLSLGVISAHAFTSGSLVLEFYSYEEIPRPEDSIAPFSATSSYRNEDAFQMVDSVNVRNILILSSAYNYPVQYDSRRIFRVGMPKGNILSLAQSGIGAFTGSYQYRVIYSTQDAKLNNIVGAESDINSVDTTNAVGNLLSVPTIQGSEGFNTDQAKVNGNQTGVLTINIDAGSGIVEGDIVYFLDRSVSSDVATSRVVTSVASTTITIAGAPVDVDDNDVLSLTLVTIVRSKDAGTLFYTAATFPNDTTVASVSVLDDTLDDDLGPLWIDHATTHGLPPKAAYLTNSNGIIVYAGILEEPNTVRTSDVEGPWYVPLETSNSFDVYSPDGGSIRGVYAFDQYLIIGLSTSVFILTGNLAERSYTVQPLSFQYGLASHFTFEQIGGSDNTAQFVVFLSSQGLCAINFSSPPVVISEPINSIFVDSSLNLRKSQAIYWPRQQLLLLYLPVEAVDSGDVYHSSDSRIFAYDYRRRAWLGPWTNINMGAGTARVDNDIYWVSKEVLADTNVGGIVSTFSPRKDSLAQADNEASIPFFIQTWWVGAGSQIESKTLKNFTHIEVVSESEDEKINCTLVLSFEKNWIPNNFSSEIAISLLTAGDAVGFGYDSFGETLFGSPVGKSVVAKIQNGKCYVIRPCVSHNKRHERPILSELTIRTVVHELRMRA